MTNATDDADDPHGVHEPFAQDALSPSENWDDDFEFQPGPAGHAPDHERDATDAPSGAVHCHEQEESWDDAYEDDDPLASPVKRTTKVDNDDVEDWDSSDSEAHEEHFLKGQNRNESNKAREFGVGLEEEDKTVTARSSSRVRPPPPPLPTSSLGSHTQHSQHPPLSFHFYVPSHPLPQPPTSPTLSSFSIPLSSNRASIYSQDPLMPSTSNSSAPHLSMRSYPEAAGSTPPRKGRRLRKKSRPPEADIFELEDRDPDPVPIVPEGEGPSTPPPQPPAPLRPSSPSPTSSPSDTRSPQPTPSPSLLTRIGSFKRWARRSIGPDDSAASSWRRTKSSTGPSEAGRPGKSSIGPEECTLPEEEVGHEMRPISPSPASGSTNNKSKLRRSRGDSASGQKAGWFFRTAGGGSEREEVNMSTSPFTSAAAPVVSQTHEPSPTKRRSALGLRRKAKDVDVEREVETPTPKKGKGKLVPVLKTDSFGSKPSPQSQIEPESTSLNGFSRDGIRLRQGTRPASMQSPPQPLRSTVFPRHGAASVGRSAGVSLSISTAISKGDHEAPANKETEKEGGMRSLMNGVRRLSLVGAGAGHKRTKSTGGDAGVLEVEAARKAQKQEITSRPRSRTEDHGVPRASNLSSDIRPVSRASVTSTQRKGKEAHTLLPPVELNSPSTQFSRRGSLPWVDYDHTSASSAGPSPVPRSSTDYTSPLSPASTNISTSNVLSDHRQLLAGDQSFSTSTTSLNSNSPGKRRRTSAVPVPIPVPSQSFGTLPRSRVVPHSSQGGTMPQLPSHPPSSPIPQAASLGRSTSSPSHSGPALRRNSLGDLKPRTLSRGELKIPARISRAQQGLRRDMGMVKEFASCVEQLKHLQATYATLLGNLYAAYEASPTLPASRPTSPTHLQFHLPSRPPSQSGTARKTITANPNSSVQSVHQVMATHPPNQMRAASNSRPCQNINRELSRLEHEYGIWWECAELLVELGSGTKPGAESNPNLTTQSASAVGTPAGEPFKELAEDVWRVAPGTHAASMSEPGSIFEQTFPESSISKGPPQASPPHPSQWRASTGRHDLNARQLRLLKDMLNTPDPASFVSVAGPYGHGPGYPQPQHPSRSHSGEDGEAPQPWSTWNPSTVTLPSEESSADPHHVSALYPHPSEGLAKEKKRRTSRLGILGLRELLRSLKRNAITEGILNGNAHHQHGSESSTSASNSAEDDHYNRRRSPYHQHDEYHTSKQSIGPDDATALEQAPPRSATSKSPRRPSLASIFRLGQKVPKAANDRSKESASKGEREVDVGMGEYSDWDRMSRSDLDLASPTVASGTATVRGKKAPPSGSSSSTNLSYQPPSTAIPTFNLSTPRKTPATSQTSLRDSSPPSGTPPQPSRLPLSVVEESSSMHAQKLQGAGPVRLKERTPSWTQARPPSRPGSRNGKPTMTGTVRSAPPSDLSSTPNPKLALTPENIKPLLEYAKEVSTRLHECIAEVKILLNATTES